MPDLISRRGIALAVYAAAIAGAVAAGFVLPDASMIYVRPMNEPEIHRAIMGAMALYVATAALPFVPGAEIGLAMLAAFGGRIALLVYLGMIGALGLAYAIGRAIPASVLARAFAWAGLGRAAALAAEAANIAPEDRTRLLIDRAPGPVSRLLLKNRYLALGLALNLPGNTVLGGGGGLAMMAGITGLFRPLPTAVTLALAVAPVPLFFALFR